MNQVTLSKWLTEPERRRLCCLLKKLPEGKVKLKHYPRPKIDYCHVDRKRISTDGSSLTLQLFDTPVVFECKNIGEVEEALAQLDRPLLVKLGKSHIHLTVMLASGNHQEVMRQGQQQQSKKPGRKKGRKQGGKGKQHPAKLSPESAPQQWEAGLSYADRTKNLRSLGWGNYEMYLNSPLWRRIRAAQLAMRSKCAGCGCRATQIHHRRYDSATLLGQTSHYLVSICRACHERIEFDELGNKRTLQEANAALDHVMASENPSYRRPF